MAPNHIEWLVGGGYDAQQSGTVKEGYGGQEGGCRARAGASRAARTDGDGAVSDPARRGRSRLRSEQLVAPGVRRGRAGACFQLRRAAGPAANENRMRYPLRHALV